mmetsp:Transcript_3130/g.11348  ORF Transcript_3130/g.11348 Transcript_3130/m.11348 type:complete len:220 (+) Transcript_3130:410-1069(+)
MSAPRRRRSRRRTVSSRSSTTPTRTLTLWRTLFSPRKSQRRTRHSRTRLPAPTSKSTATLTVLRASSSGLPFRCFSLARTKRSPRSSSLASSPLASSSRSLSSYGTSWTAQSIPPTTLTKGRSATFTTSSSRRWSRRTECRRCCPPRWSTSRCPCAEPRLPRPSRSSSASLRWRPRGTRRRRSFSTAAPLSSRHTCSCSHRRRHARASCRKSCRRISTR